MNSLYKDKGANKISPKSALTHAYYNSVALGLSYLDSVGKGKHLQRSKRVMMDFEDVT